MRMLKMALVIASVSFVGSVYAQDIEESADTAVTTISCYSRGWRTSYCTVGGTIHHISLIQRYGWRPCVAGTNYGYTGNYVWVRGGCSGQFRVNYDLGHGND